MTPYPLMFANAAERLNVLHKLGWPGHIGRFCHDRKLNDVVTEVIRWNHERDKPRPWHYAIRLYRRVALPRKDWRLPWR